MDRTNASLEDLEKEDLIQRILDLQEEIRMNTVFTEIGETDSKDAILQWRGRNRFLAEKIIPVRLEPIAEDSYAPEKANHRIINGDNLAVMASLLTEFRGGRTNGIDVIYMDPPYNTGNDVFSYRDDFSYSPSEVRELRRRVGRAESLVSLDDPNRHTKWINHMAPRLWAAKKLLKSTGVIIVSIDEHELPRLWMLMEEIFDERNRIATLIWNRSRKNDATYISEGHEYMLVWAKNKEELDAKVTYMASTPEWKNDEGKWRIRKDGAEAILTAYMEAKNKYGDNIPEIQKALNAFFAELPKDHPAKKIRYKKVNQNGVYNDDGDLNWPGGGGPRYEVIHPVTGKPCRIPSSGWRFIEDEMRQLIAQGRIAFKATHNGIPRYIKYLHEMENEVRTSVFLRSGQRAVEVVDAVLGKGSFKNPKDHEILAELFNLVTWRDKNAILLDAYAGSGTAGHAILDMNLEDNGDRRFILIENGDPSVSAKISREEYASVITADRIRRVISGEWNDSKEHAVHNTGFTFYCAREEITKSAIMASTRERLADIILQVVEDETNRIDCRVEGYQYLIGRTRSGLGIALVWQAKEGSNSEQTLTWDIMETILDEAVDAKVNRPVHIYATEKNAPIDDDLYHFHQIPNSILARLGISDVDGEEE